MEKLCFLVLISLSFVFGQQSKLKKPLNAFTVFLHNYTELFMICRHNIFSYVTKKEANDLPIFWSKVRGYILGVYRPKIFFKAPEIPIAPGYICVSWKSIQGLVELWVEWKPKMRRSLETGLSVGIEAMLILGQDQDSFCGRFSVSHSSVGDIGDVNMWIFVVSPEEIGTVYASGIYSPNVLDLWALTYKTHPEVFVKPQVWP
ncbi:LOW QUALITY PROTEIN: C-reactive protein [Octodon degus]|uniref:Pentraxin family member n=1 Tax=Octodon degus TaxID=10160 RepID=A0A6P3VCK5_OCTDE|nr:LOW QUALITY PROTEIN: C-reactive protein [Octodon degus]